MSVSPLGGSARSFALNLPFDRRQEGIASLLEHLSKTLLDNKIHSSSISEVHYVGGTYEGQSLPTMTVTLYEATMRESG